MTAIHTDQYPASYYFASLKYQHSYSQLTDNIEADICIIGGGFTGIASAIELTSLVFFKFNLLFKFIFYLPSFSITQ